ncbi:MAG: GrpB family protein [Asgard group archaeon]|nr:GrpB family protein [Asgard group archaeon]
MSTSVKLVKYNPKWPKQFDLEKQLILKTFQNFAIHVEHIGSTAIPGVSSKPIIDIMVGIESLAKLAKYIELFKTIGYNFNPEWEDEHPERKALDKYENGLRIHLYVVEFNTDYWLRHIQFRDYLREHPEVAKEYNRLKVKLAEKYREDRSAYTSGKSQFIKKIEKKAKKKYQKYTS